MKVFISRLYLIDSWRNSRFPAEIASLLFVIEGLLGISVIYTPKPIFLWAHQ